MVVGGQRAHTPFFMLRLYKNLSSRIGGRRGIQTVSTVGTLLVAVVVGLTRYRYVGYTSHLKDVLYIFSHICQAQVDEVSSNTKQKCLKLYIKCLALSINFYTEDKAFHFFVATSQAKQPSFRCLFPLLSKPVTY